MIKGVIFDLDGVITDTAEYHYLAWKALAEELGIEIDRTFNEQLKGVSRTDSLERILAHGGKSEEYSETEKAALADKKNTHYVELIERITPADLLPGIPEFLEEIKANGIKIALASASKNGPMILDKLGIADDFDVVIDPSTLSKGKPDPEIFEKAAEALGFDSSEVIGVEDAEAGIEAINGAGIFSIGVGEPHSMRKANYIVADTSQLNLETIKKVFSEQ